MDDRQLPASGHGLQGPHRAFTFPDFLPLRLLLQPGGLCVELTQPDTLLGRHSEADVRLAVPDVSRRHCRLVFGHGQWKIIDLNSLNGVYVNGERMQEATVYDGDRIRLGSLTFAVQLPACLRPEAVEILPVPEDHRQAS